MTYTIIKSFNNNVLLCTEQETGAEVMLIGTGIGFSKRPNDVFHETERIDKKFVLSDDEQTSNFKQMFLSLNENYLGAATEAMSIIEERLQQSIPNQKRLALVDHIVFALQRVEEGYLLESPFIDEVRVLYTHEWNIAQSVVEHLNLSAQSKLPIDEVAFITFHIASIVEEKKPTESRKTAAIVADCVSFVETTTGHALARTSLAYSRFVSHLRFVVERSITGEIIENPMTEHIAEKLPQPFHIAEQLAGVLLKKYKIQLTRDEQAFIALHLSRILSK
ncbi:MAG: PRD domain-containing protein [Bacilli bacterium]